ncbi:nucleolar and coiled-body phosphoprotein 1 [Canna indica]|uniref:Nucleolar and coiled-body phosphoprotein 1 n=1 Tax=Canna indica TaxID=4628 RepID=A0AAQ3KKZ9_9LILI|nr:nucleolar and coiled-body phosphoprotein 1 [Canna indica]
MRGSPPPSKAAYSSSVISFVPRQIMLERNTAVAAVKEDGKERRKEKKEKKEKKKRSSETLQLDRTDVGSVPRKGKGIDVLLRSIAAFLDSNGFSKTLSMLQSEAELESGCWKSSTVDLEDLFCKFLDSSNGNAEGIVDWLSNQDLQKVILSEGKLMNHASEKTEKKKRKRYDQVDDIETETNKTSVEKGFAEGIINMEKLAGAVLHKPSQKVVGSESEGLCSDNANLSANQLVESHESCKEKKKKNKVMPKVQDTIVDPNDSGKLKEMVEAKGEELVSLTNNSIESSKKQKGEKKKAKMVKETELESDNTSKKLNDTKLVDAEGHADAAAKSSLDDNDSQNKVKKKKKQKSTSDVTSNLSSDQAGEKSSDLTKICDTNQEVAHDFVEQSVPQSDDSNIKVTKKSSKKRKVSDSGEKADNEIATKKSKVKSEDAENNKETGNLAKLDKGTIESHTPVITKKKINGGQESAKNADKQQELSTKTKENGNASNSKNEVLGTKLEISSIGKKEKQSAEPKSVNPFQRVKIDDVKFADDRLKNNSYWAKDGADIGYGAKAQEVLGQVRGRDFRHEKTKKKRGSYRGGQIDLESHSIKFNYSDEE